MQDRKNCAFVYIIESPSNQDIIRNINEGESLTSALKLARIEYHYNLVQTKKEFFDSIYELNKLLRQNHKTPILHLSMHGNKDEIGLTDQSRIKWDELCNLIKSIQDYLSCFSCDLLICSSSCYGIFVGQMAKIQKGIIPFKFLVGSEREVDWSDAAVAYTSFYHNFFKGCDLAHCVKTMNVASNYYDFKTISGNDIQLKWQESLEEEINKKAEEIVSKLEQISRNFY
ncbi:hypothetical protein [Nostoc sp. WHI]|uniref:hypothetical protein n=1 Tax=Nostoc sp. WHI TaxID=2650611 RepID=UPI0018C74371|nr:hypothetical protein [Nostoc sp. WHI]MBG1271293.1 hypothetical protein [Nostoc sp. WHI]